MGDNVKNNIFKKYRVLFVMVPGIVLIHVVWLKLQSNPNLIKDSEKERSKLPVFMLYESLKDSIYKKLGISEKESSQNKD